MQKAFLPLVMLIAIALLSWPIATKAEKAASSPTYLAEMVLKLDGILLDRPAITFSKGQSMSIENVDAGYKLIIKTADNVNNRTQSLFNIDLSKEDREHTLLEGEIFLAEGNSGEWIKAASPILLSELGVTGKVEQEIAVKGVNAQKITFEARVTRQQTD